MNRLGNLFQESAKKINLLNETLGRGSKIEEETIEWKKSSNNIINRNKNKKDKAKPKFSSHPNNFDSEDDSDNNDKKAIRKETDFHKEFHVNGTNWLNLNGFKDLTLKGAKCNSHLNYNHKVTFEHFKAKSFASSTGDSKITIPSEISSCATLISEQPNLDVLKKDALNMQLQLKEKKRDHNKLDSNKQKFKTTKKRSETSQNNNKIKSRTTSSATLNTTTNDNKTFYIDCHKMLSLLEKSIGLIENIEHIIDCGIEPPDGSEDYKRKRKRAIEFASRFSRNYLYTLGRQRADLFRLTNCGKHTYRTKTMTAQKIVSASQIILQALQAYLHYLPSCLPDSLHEKLQELIRHSLEICNLYSSFVEDSPYVNDKSRYLVESFQAKFGNCLEKLQQISNNILERNNNIPLAGTKISLYSTKESVKSLQQKKKKALAARLSMYKDSSIRKDTPWKKAVEALAKQRLKYSHVKSRYKTFIPKHRQSEETIEVQNKFPPPQPERKQLPHMLKNTPLTTPLHEDHITTMVELENNRNHKNVHQPDKKLQDLIINIQQLVQEIDKKEDNNKSSALLNGFIQTNGEKVADNNPQHDSTTILENLAFQLHRYCSREKQTDVDQKNDENEDKIHDDELSRENKKGSRDSQRGSTPNKKNRIVSVTGPKNAKLIHMVRNDDDDDNNVGDKVETSKEIVTNNNNDCNDQATVVVYEEEKPKKAQTKTKGGLVRLKAPPLKQLDLLPKTEVVEIVKYKMNYSKFSKCSCMYRKSSKMQPWILLRNVSEKLFRELLMSIVRELEMPQLLEKMYLSEFQ